MAVQTHSINSSLRLNHYFSVNPEIEVSKLTRKAFAFNVLEKICWVAFLAITAAVFAISYTGVALTGHLPFLMVGLTLLSPLFAIGASHCKGKVQNFTSQAKQQQGIAEKAREIAGWRTAEIRAFFQEQNLDPDRLPIELLRQKNPQEPLRALLPLIARFKFLHALAHQAKDSARENLNGRIERELNDLEARRGNPIDEEEKRTIRLANRQIAWRRLEFEAYPRLLEAALILHIIQNPTLEMSLSDLGSFRAKTFEERMFDRLYAPQNDHYFVFQSNSPRQPITATELDAQFQAHFWRARLFP